MSFNSVQHKPNRLAGEKSPYLLQHADNPVDWYPWGQEAFDKAASENKPVFLSIGYATCHWCHVMAHESFEDSQVAGLLNEFFVSVKVDREERPDVDQLYMTVCQALTQRGGWPLSIFLSPDGKPFFAGTYFPKTARMGMPGFVDVLNQLARLWKEDRGRIEGIGEDITKAVRAHALRRSEERTLGEETLQKAYSSLARAFDPKFGGFGSAPKFPSPHQLTFLMRRHARTREDLAAKMVIETLDSMRAGGIFDHLGFGFHRYSVDERWLVPHFEKMLYDQAMLALAYTESFLLFGKERHRKTAEEIFEYVLRDMTSPEGGFYSAEDADSEGKEGVFYVWKPDQVLESLGEEDGELFCRFYDIGAQGNFEEGFSIPHISRDLETFAHVENRALSELEEILERCRGKLFRTREKREHPLKDDKIISSWNGLMVAALACGARAFDNPHYAKAACRAADFILDRLSTPEGRLFRRFRDGEPAHAGFVDDYAFMVWGLIELYEAGFDIRYLEEAVRLNDLMLGLFRDDSSGGLFYSGKDNEVLVAQTKELHDGAIPSANSVAVLNLMRLGRLTGNAEWEAEAERMFQAFSGELAEAPMAYTFFMCALDFRIGPVREIVIAGDPDTEGVRELARAVRRRFMPNKALLLRPDGPAAEKVTALAPYAENMTSLDGRPTAYVCEQYACRAPVRNVDDLEALL